jgi:hypothetical protein
MIIKKLEKVPYQRVGGNSQTLSEEIRGEKRDEGSIWGREKNEIGGIEKRQSSKSSGFEYFELWPQDK